jgi:hypothetical protein
VQYLCFIQRDSALQVFSLAALLGRSVKNIARERGVEFSDIVATDFRFHKFKYCTEPFTRRILFVP